MQHTRSRFDCLTGIRFLAALYVVFFHTLEWRHWSTGPLRMFVSSGGAAVSFFFILSGFILTHTYASPGSGPAPIRSYYSARFARVYPVYALGLVVSAPLFVADHVASHKLPQMLVKAMAAVTLTQSYVPRLVLAWNGPGWSLSNEVFFYLLFPMIAALVTKLSWRSAVHWLAAVWLIAISVPLAYLAVQPDGPGRLEIWSYEFWANLVRYNPAIRVPEFVFGMLTARIHALRLRNETTIFGSRGLPELIAVTIVLALALRTENQYLFVHNGGLAPLFCLLILALCGGHGPLVRLLSSRPLVLLGEASYALYVLHEPISHIVAQLARDYAPGWIGSWSFCAVVCIISTTASALVVRYFEAPLRRRLKNVFEQKQIRQDIQDTQNAKLIVA